MSTKLLSERIPMNLMSRTSMLCGVVISTAFITGNFKEVTTMAEYKKIIGGDKPVVVKVYTEWCSLCPQYEPTFKSVAKDHTDHAVFISVNAEKQGFKALFEGHVTGYPTTLVVKGGEITATRKGLIDKRMLTKFVTDNITTTKPRPSRPEDKPMVIEEDVAVEDIESIMMPMDRDMDMGEEEIMAEPKPTKKPVQKKIQKSEPKKKSGKKSQGCSACNHNH